MPGCHICHTCWETSAEAVWTVQALADAVLYAANTAVHLESNAGTEPTHTAL